MKYKKFHQVLEGANTIKSLWLRQQFALKLLKLIADGKRILNLDQTPLGDSNFLGRSWMPSHLKLSGKIHPISPRITMMTAIDTYGDTYWSLLQANSNGLTMELVLTNLAQILDKERPGWR